MPQAIEDRTNTIEASGFMPLPRRTPSSSFGSPVDRPTSRGSLAQVMMTETGPCLVEVNSRCHGVAGSWMPLAHAMTGYTQEGWGGVLGGVLGIGFFVLDV